MLLSGSTLRATSADYSGALGARAETYHCRAAAQAAHLVQQQQQCLAAGRSACWAQVAKLAAAAAHWPPVGMKFHFCYYYFYYYYDFYYCPSCFWGRRVSESLFVEAGSARG